MTKLLQLITLLLLGNYGATISAASLKVPSNAQVKKMIKNEMKNGDNPEYRLLAGFDRAVDSSYLVCNQPKVNKIRILKRGKAFNSFVKDSGRYVNSWFNIKFTVDGSCKLSAPGEVDSKFVYIDGHSGLKVIIGRVPFRKIPIRASFTTDDYGDWQVNISANYSKYTLNGKKITETRYNDEVRKSYRLKLYEQRNPKIFWKNNKELYVLKGKKLVLDRALNRLDEKAALAKKKIQDSLKHDREKIRTILMFTKFKRRSSKYYVPNVENLFMAQPAAYRARFLKLYDQALVEGMSMQQSHQVLQREINRWKSRSKGQQTIRKKKANSSSNKHSHGGRFHTHKLPRQGKSHRHGNGPIGH